MHCGIPNAYKITVVHVEVYTILDKIAIKPNIIFDTIVQKRPP